MAKPDGQLTLPGDFGHKWAAWYIAKVRELYKLCRIVEPCDEKGRIVPFHKTFSTSLEAHLKALPDGRDLVLSLTDADKGWLNQLTMAHAKTREAKREWLDCIWKRWKEIVPPKLDVGLTPQRRAELEEENRKPIPTFEDLAKLPKPVAPVVKVQKSLM